MATVSRVELRCNLCGSQTKSKSFVAEIIKKHLLYEGAESVVVRVSYHNPYSNDTHLCETCGKKAITELAKGYKEGQK